jgi:hypothetical protein
MYSGIPVAAARPIDADGIAAGQNDVFPVNFLGLASATNVFAYTATDVSLGTIDIVTGVAVVTGGIGNRTAGQVRTALYGAAGTNINNTLTVPGTFDIPAPAYCIGILSYNAWRTPGGNGSNPNSFTFTNFAKQDQLAITCDYVIEVPAQAAAAVTVANILTAATLANNLITFAADTTTALNLTDIDTAQDYVVTITTGGAVTTVTSHVTVISAATIQFDIDLAAGDIITVTYADTNTYANPMLTGTPLYVADISGAATGTLVHVGTYVKSGASEGFYVPWVLGTGVTPTDNPAMILGQVISVDATIDRGGLSMVKTQYEAGALSTIRTGLSSSLYSMPGSATSGKQGALHRALGSNTNGVVRINILK